MILPMVPMLDAAPTGSVRLRGESTVNPGYLFRLQDEMANGFHRWDPASGLGTPNYPRLQRLFMSLP